MIRIIIEIDGAEAATTTVHPQVATEVFTQVPAAPTARAGLTPPPEVLAAAAALGAMDAGPAPTMDAASGMPGVPTVQGATAAEPEVMDAGKAPETPPDEAALENDE